MADYVASLARARAAERSVAVSSAAAALPEAEVDALQVQQAMLNLALNAVEAAEPGGAVRIGAEPRADGALCLYVEDDGPAIPAESLGHIFEPFFTTKPHGTGLGLAIARAVARAHGGDVELAANEPGRVRFEILIPARPPAGADAERNDGTDSGRR
jgi:signal transduction histidine kinase